MRIVNTCVLALVLGTTLSAWGQTPKADPPAAINPPAANATDPDATSIFAHPDALSQEDVLPRPAKPNLFWLRTDYLQWWISREPITPIILTLPDSLATAASIPAGAGAPVFPANNTLAYGTFSGVRLNTGIWFNSDRTLGVDFSGFYLENRSLDASYSSSGSPILTRFYNNIGGQRETYLLFSSPDPAAPYSGALSASISTSDLYNFDASLRWNGYRIFSDNADYLYGFRYLKFDESININGRANLSDGRVLLVNDNFRVRNDFYGAQIGVASRWVGLGRLSLDSVLKFAIGGVQQRVSISGSNAFISPNGQVDAQPAGLWATAANSGNFSKGKFAVLPELNLNLSYNVTDRLALTVGYSAMIISNVVRVNSIINPNINDSTVRYISNTTPSTVPNPGFTFNDTGMWISGLNFGVRWEY